MCIIEQRTYLSGNRREIRERVRPCRYAVGSSLCSQVETRVVEEANLVERRPETGRAKTDSMLVTEGFNGRRNVYRELGRHSSKRTLGRHSNAVSEWSPVEGSPSPSSSTFSSYAEQRPAAPSPPPAAPNPRSRPASAGDRLLRTVAPDGTAIYERPLSRELPGTRDNERRTQFVALDDPLGASGSSTAADSGRAVPATRGSRRPSMTVDTTLRSPMSSSPSTSSPGLSQLPKLSTSRHDSASGLPPYRSRENSVADRQRRQREEDERQAQIERGRLAASESRQQARRDASRERHLAAAAAALEGSRQQQRDQEATARMQLDAEYAQMERERANATTRRRESDLAARYAEERLRADAEATLRYQESRGSPRAQRRVTTENYAPPITSPLSASAGHPPIVHQEPRPRLQSTLRNQGEAVIVREQNRAERAEQQAGESSSARRAQGASRQLSYVMGELDLDGEAGIDVEYDLDDYEVQERLGSRESRRGQRDRERAERRRGFFR